MNIFNTICIWFDILGLCPDWEDWDPKKPERNATEAMDQAEQWLDVPQVMHIYFTSLYRYPIQKQTTSFPDT